MSNKLRGDPKLDIGDVRPTASRVIDKLDDDHPAATKRMVAGLVDTVRDESEAPDHVPFPVAVDAAVDEDIKIGGPNVDNQMRKVAGRLGNVIEGTYGISRADLEHEQGDMLPPRADPEVRAKALSSLISHLDRRLTTDNGERRMKTLDESVQRSESRTRNR